MTNDNQTQAELNRERNKASALAETLAAERFRADRRDALVRSLEEQVASLRGDASQAETLELAKKQSQAEESSSLRARLHTVEAALAEERARWSDYHMQPDGVEESLLEERQRNNELRNEVSMLKSQLEGAQRQIVTMEERVTVALTQAAQADTQDESERKQRDEFTAFCQRHMEHFESELLQAQRHITEQEQKEKIYTETIEMLKTALVSAGLSSQLLQVDDSMQDKWAGLSRLQETKRARDVGSGYVRVTAVAREKHDLLEDLRAERRTVAALEAQLALERGVTQQTQAELETLRLALSSEEGVVSSAKETAVGLAELCQQRQLEHGHSELQWEEERRMLSARAAHWEDKYNAAITRARSAETARGEEMVRAREFNAEADVSRRQLDTLRGELEAMSMQLRAAQRDVHDAQAEAEAARREQAQQASKAQIQLEAQERRLVELERDALPNASDDPAAASLAELPLLRLQLEAVKEEYEATKVRLQTTTVDLDQSQRKEHIASQELSRLREKEKTLWAHVQQLENFIATDRKAVEDVAVGRQELEKRCSTAETEAAKAQRDLIDMNRRLFLIKKQYEEEVAKRQEAEKIAGQEAVMRTAMEQQTPHTHLSVQNLSSKLASANAELEALMADRRTLVEQNATVTAHAQQEALQRASNAARMRRLETAVLALHHQLQSHGVVPSVDGESIVLSSTQPVASPQRQQQQQPTSPLNGNDFSQLGQSSQSKNGNNNDVTWSSYLDSPLRASQIATPAHSQPIQSPHAPGSANAAAAALRIALLEQAED